MVVYLKREGGQRQFSAPLAFQTATSNRFADLVIWIADNLHEPLSVDQLAARACLSSRQFARRFAEATGLSPGIYLESLRLSTAAERLISTKASVAAIAQSVGFSSADAFTRAFGRRFGLAPRAYRDRFSSANPSRHPT